MVNAFKKSCQVKNRANLSRVGMGISTRVLKITTNHKKRSAHGVRRLKNNGVIQWQKKAFWHSAHCPPRVSQVAQANTCQVLKLSKWPKCTSLVKSQICTLRNTDLISMWFKSVCVQGLFYTSILTLDGLQFLTLHPYIPCSF